ncbi:TIR domain-containing protein [Streptomyces sp. NPDC046909]|uniref:TIR domain-containing protein n=1 Tax=Streptomyces sp. NPDC046909 TaxID=3155617 RepID=UPI0034013579
MEFGVSSSDGLWLSEGVGRAPAEYCGRYVVWSPDGRLLAVPDDQRTVRILDTESDTDLTVLRANGTNSYVNTVSWSPDGSRLVAACGHDGVRVWNLDRPGPPWHLTAHTRWVGQVAWSRSSDLFASGAQDGTAMVWDARGEELMCEFPIGGYINGLAWSPDDEVLAAGSSKQTVTTWEVPDGVFVSSARAPDIVTCLAWSPDGGTLVAGAGEEARCLAVDDEGFLQGVVNLEGHTDHVQQAMFSAGGKLLATAADDHTVRLWRTDDWTTVAVLELPHAEDDPDADPDRDSGFLAAGHSSDWGNWSREAARPALAFHPTLPRLAVWTNQSGLSLWDYDLDRLLAQQGADESVRYMTAKVVLVGDSGVGKTGLGWRLAYDEFREHASTHGQQFWVVDDIRTQRTDGTDCEAVLWDLAGQHVYRPVHAIFLDNVDLALVLFDPSNRQEPLKGVRFWLRQLSGGHRLPPAVLVGARVDRGAPAIPRSELEQFCQRHEISGGYVSTSAATGAGVAELMELVRGQIQWERMTTTVTTVTFKRIREFVLALKERPDPAGVLVFPADLRRQLQSTDPDWEFSDAEMMTAVGHLENHGYVCVLRNSHGAQAVLLTPGLLVELASSVFLQADKHPQELGAISEAALLGGEHWFPELEELSPAERQVLLDAAVVRFLEHNLCFRDTLGAEILLIFPGLIKQKRPLFDAVETADDMTYVVRGQVENVYPALVVLLGHTPTFTRVNYWQNQAQFEMGSGQICGLRLLQEREGEIELVLHYSEDVPPYGRSMFQGLFESFLYQRDVTVTVFPSVVCANRHKQDRTAVIHSLRDEMRTMFCFRCGDRITLPEIEGPIAFGAEDTRRVGRDQAAARLRSAYETHLVRVKSFRADRAVPRCYISHLPEDAGWSEQLARDLRQAGVLVVADAHEVREGDVVLAVVTPAYGHAFVRSAGGLAADAALIRARRRAPDGRTPNVVPLLRAGTVETACPAELRGLVAGEFLDDTRYAVGLFDLVLTLYAIPFNQPAFKALRDALRLEWVRQEADRAVLTGPAAEHTADVYLSYSWSEESNALADELDAAFQARGVTLVRDRRDAGFKASISRFMERIGRGKCVVLVISDAYLKSQSCLFELLKVAAHGEFRDRVFPVVLPDARIQRPQDRVAYVRYWEEQIRELDEALKSVSAAHLHGFREDMDLYTEIRAQLPRLADVLRDMNALTPDQHRAAGFSVIFEAVMARLES